MLDDQFGQKTETRMISSPEVRFLFSVEIGIDSAPI
jgi:hypothetical protein